MPNLNHVTVIGHLGKDPELRHAGSSQVCNFTVASSKKFKGKDGEDKQITEWHAVQVWGDQAVDCNSNLAKGDAVIVVGEIATRSWEGSDGVKKYKTEIRAMAVGKWVGSMKQSAGASPDSYMVEDDLPF